MDAILNRRSVRDFTDQTVSNEDIRELLRSAMRAPSAFNQQPWDFIVVRDKGILSSVTSWHEYAEMLKKADCAILVCGNKQRAKAWDWWAQDCSAATQNILIKATDLGLGAVWLGMYPMEDRVNNCQKLFELPDHITAFSMVALGHPSQPIQPVDTFDETRIHQEKW